MLGTVLYLCLRCSGEQDMVLALKDLNVVELSVALRKYT